LQNSKVAAPRIFRENKKRETITDSYTLSRGAEIAGEFNARGSAPHVLTRKTRLQPAEFLITCAKRLLQHNLGKSRHQSKKASLPLLTHQRHSKPARRHHQSAHCKSYSSLDRRPPPPTINSTRDQGWAGAVFMAEMCGERRLTAILAGDRECAKLAN